MSSASRQLAKVVRRVEFITGLFPDDGAEESGFQDVLRCRRHTVSRPGHPGYAPAWDCRRDCVSGRLDGCGRLRREVFMPDPIADADLASMWATLGTSWRNGAIIKRVL
jgi:hypothetical protein